MQTTKKYTRTIDKIVYPVDGSRGAPTGRSNVIPDGMMIVDMSGSYKVLLNPETKEKKRIFDCAVPMPDGCYDKGGAYWGMGKQLRVSYTKDLTYVNFYRLGDK